MEEVFENVEVPERDEIISRPNWEKNTARNYGRIMLTNLTWNR